MDGLQDQSSNHRTLRGDEIPGGEQSEKRRSLTSSGMDQEDERE